MDLKITLYYEVRLDRPCWRFDELREVYQYLEQLTEGTGPTTRDEIRRIEVTLPHPLLAEGLVISDTPGFGAGQPGDSAGTHEAALKMYLSRDVSQVFWVVLADQGIGRREVDFHDRFFSEVCDDLVVTGCEDWDTDDRARFRRRFGAFLGDRSPCFHFVSGLQGLEARRTADQQALEAAGIVELEHRIRDLSNPEGRLHSVEKELVRLSEDLSFWLAGYRDERGRPLAAWWRPDSWSRWAATGGSFPLKKILERRLARPEPPG